MDIKTGDDIQIDVIGFQRIRQITLCSGRIVCQDDITVANGIFSGCFQTVTGKRIRIFGEFNSIGKVIDIEIPVIAVYIFANLIFCRRIGFFQRMDLFGIAVGIDKLGDGKISTGKEKNIHTQYMLI